MIHPPVFSNDVPLILTYTVNNGGFLIKEYIACHLSGLRRKRNGSRESSF